MEAVFTALVARLDITHLALLTVIGLQQWQIRDQSKNVQAWIAAMDRLAETLVALRVKIAERGRD